jgi:hypothetical protein
MGEAGPSADRLANEMLRAVRSKSWEKTTAVRWTWAGAKHLWDRKRGFAQVEWGDARVLIDLEHRTGLAFVDGREATGDEAAELVDAAHARWTNDSFWLNPMVKVFDPGTERQRVEGSDPSERGLLVRFNSGGRTPGDTFVFWLAGNGLPIRWQMWASIIPVKGVSATWDGWIALKTGALISTSHEIGPLDIRVGGVEGAYTLSWLAPGPDPFAPLLERRATADQSRPRRR